MMSSNDTNFVGFNKAGFSRGLEHHVGRDDTDYWINRSDIYI